MGTYYIDETLTTGLDDGSSWANAFQSLGIVSGKIGTVTEDHTFYVRLDATVSNQRTFGGLDPNGHTLTVIGDSAATFYSTGGYASLFTVGGVGSSGQWVLKNFLFNLAGTDQRGVTIEGSVPVDAVSCIFFGNNNVANRGVYVNGGTCNAYNCISVGMALADFDVDSSGTLSCTNCYAEGTGTGYRNTSSTLNLTTCASGDTTGSSGLQSISYDTTTFTNVTSGSEDFHLVSGSPLIGAGTVTPSYTTDFDGDAWGDPQDIGVYVYVTTTTYALTYNGNSNDGGTAPTDPSSPYDDGDTVTVLGNTGSLVRAGYIWAGWNTATDGSGTHYDSGDTFTISTDTALYAEWVLAIITGVTYDNDLAILPSCTVTLFSFSGGTYTQVDSTTSDGTTGAYSFTVSDGIDYMIVAFLAGTPNVFDCSDSNINLGDSVNLYLRSQANKTVPSGDGIFFYPPEYKG